MSSLLNMLIEHRDALRKELERTEKLIEEEKALHAKEYGERVQNGTAEIRSGPRQFSGITVYGSDFKPRPTYKSFIIQMLQQVGRAYVTQMTEAYMDMFPNSSKPVVHRNLTQTASTMKNGEDALLEADETGHQYLYSLKNVKPPEEAEHKKHE